VKYADALARIDEAHATVTSRLFPLFVPYAALSIWLSGKERATRLQAFDEGGRTLKKEVEI